MPTYEYRCSKCGYDFEAVQRFSDDPLTECPKCGAPVHKVFSSVGVVFKGSGFYSTDNKTSAKPPKPAKETKQASEPAVKKEATPAKEAKSDAPTA